MGYYTGYTLEVKENRSTIDTYDVERNLIELLREREVIDYALDENLETYDHVKWYDHDRHMKDISTQIKDVVFKLHGEGEENGDIWDKYYLNGKEQCCKAEFKIPPFDESKLV